MYRVASFRPSPACDTNSGSRREDSEHARIQLFRDDESEDDEYDHCRARAADPEVTVGLGGERALPESGLRTVIRFGNEEPKRVRIPGKSC